MNTKMQLGAADGLDGSAEYRFLLRAGKVVEVRPVRSNEVAGALPRLQQLRFDAMFPPGSGATLIHAGVLNCYGGKCELFVKD